MSIYEHPIPHSMASRSIWKPSVERRFWWSTWPPSAASPLSTPDSRSCKAPTRTAASPCSGVPCNQFGGQEPGSAEEIATFCSSTYGVTFPITEKVDVNGQQRHALYTELTAKPDAEGRSRRHPMELREVPDLSRRRGRRPFPTHRGARCRGAGRRRRTRPAQLTIPAAAPRGSTKERAHDGRYVEDGQGGARSSAGDAVRTRSGDVVTSRGSRDRSWAGPACWPSLRTRRTAGSSSPCPTTPTSRSAPARDVAERHGPLGASGTAGR